MSRSEAIAKTFLKPRVHISGLVSALVFLCGVGTVAGFAGRYAWWLDLASHFRVQYATVLAIFFILALVGRHRGTAFTAGLLAALNVAVVVPLYFNGVTAPTTSGTRYRAMLVNVNTHWGSVPRVIAAISNHAPDFVVLEEVDRTWLRELQAISNDYPYQVAHPRSDNFGIALFSRQAFELSDAMSVGELDVPTVYAQLSSQNRRFTVVGTHPVPPRNRQYARYRDIQLAQLPAFLHLFRGPLVLLGDLNATPWSYHFRRLLERTALHDSLQGYGVQATWPSYAWPMLIPIDHCLYRDGIVILDRWVGEDIGSDHYPVIVDFALGRDT